jgi:hypothetical protein
MKEALEFAINRPSGEDDSLSYVMEVASDAV